MVKLTISLIIKRGLNANQQTSKSNEAQDNILQKQTHLYLQKLNIDDISTDLSKCKNLLVLYLQENNIESLKLNCINITYLYVQNNNIKHLNHFSNLVNLQKLYLGHNSIKELTGLEALTNLEELHIEKQRLLPDETFEINRNCVIALKDKLKILVISHNKINSLQSLLALENLQVLKAGYNELYNLHEIVNAVQTWSELKELYLQGNPMCNQLRYRETIIGASYHALGVLDKKEILPVNRSFLQSLALRRASRNIQPCSAKRSGALDSDEIGKSLQLTIDSKNYACLPEDIDEKQNLYMTSHFPAWKSGKSKSAKLRTPEHIVKNWIPQSAGAVGRRKSCSSGSTDLSQNLHISKFT